MKLHSLSIFSLSALTILVLECSSGPGGLTVQYISVRAIRSQDSYLIHLPIQQSLLWSLYSFPTLWSYKKLVLRCPYQETKLLEHVKYQ